MSRAEELFQRGAPLLQSLPLDGRQRLVAIARTKSPNAAFRVAQEDISLLGKTELERLAIGKTVRWLAIIQTENRAVFEHQVRLLLASADGARDEEKSRWIRHNF
jgi:hypothetical protein